MRMFYQALPAALIFSLQVEEAAATKAI